MAAWDLDDARSGRSEAAVLASYEDAFGEPPSAHYWAHAYDAATLLAAAIESAAVEEGGVLHIDMNRATSTLFLSGMLALLALAPAVTEACRPGIERLGYPVDAPRLNPAVSWKAVEP